MSLSIPIPHIIAITEHSSMKKNVKLTCHKKHCCFGWNVCHVINKHIGVFTLSIVCVEHDRILKSNEYNWNDECYLRYL